MTNNTPDYTDNLYFEEKKMSDLTEQWKKGELPCGWYWVKRVTWCECIDMLYYWSDTFLDGDVPVDNDEIMEVLAPVPTFDEWMNTQKEIQKKAYELGNLGYRIKNQRKEIEKQITQNAELKELLKRVNEHFKWVDKDDPFYVEDKLWDDIKKVLEKKGNEVLK